jgi:hypothetical protein
LAVFGGETDARPDQVKAPDVAGLDLQIVETGDRDGFFHGPESSFDTGDGFESAIPLQRVFLVAASVGVESGAEGIGDELIEAALVHIRIEEQFDTVVAPDF